MKLKTLIFLTVCMGLAYSITLNPQRKRKLRVGEAKGSIDLLEKKDPLDITPAQWDKAFEAAKKKLDKDKDI